MKKLLLPALLAFCFNGFSQAPSIAFQQLYGGQETQFCNSGTKTTDGGYVIAGRHATTQQYDFWVAKFDASHNIVWDKKYGGSGNEETRKIIQTSDGGYMLVGGTGSVDGDITGAHGQLDAWILKLDASGEKEWQKTLGGSTEDEARDVLQTEDGGYIIVGFSDSVNGDLTENNGQEDFWVFKLSAQGNLEWSKVYGGSYEDIPYAIQSTDDGGHIIGGLTSSNNGDVSGNNGNVGNLPDGWLIKISEDGTLQWQKCFGSTSYDGIWSIAKTSDGNFIMGAEAGAMNGSVTTPIAGDTDVWILKIDQFGEILWQNTFGGSQTDYANHIVQTNTGYLISSQSRSNDGDVSGNHGDYEGWLLKLGNDGNLQWQKCLGGSSFEHIVYSARMSDNKILVLGSTESSDGDIIGTPQDADAWIVKLEPEVLSTNTFLIENISLYPNPAKTILNIKISDNYLIENVRIIDMSGKLVHENSSGQNSINIENLQSGIYLIEVLAENINYQGKFLKQ